MCVFFLNLFIFFQKLAENKIFEGYEVELVPLRFASAFFILSPLSLFTFLFFACSSFFFFQKKKKLLSKLDGRSLINQGGSSALLDDIGKGEKSTHFLLFVLDQSAAEFGNGAWFLSFFLSFFSFLFSVFCFFFFVCFFVKGRFFF